MSVCLPNAGTVYKRMACHIIKLFLTEWYGHHSSFFHAHRRYNIPRAVPSAKALNTWGWENLAKIDLYLENGTR